MQMTGPCVFGTAGRLSVGGVRKGIDKVIRAFLDAFPSNPDVRLCIKIFPDCRLPLTNDSRIVILRKYLTEREMARWYRSITCFISAARSEGWGLMQHQALATGRPVVSVEYGGITEFFGPDVGYPVDYKLVPADSYYQGCGLWAEPSHDSLVDRMRQIYENRFEARKLGDAGASKVAPLSWRASNEKLIEILHRIGMLPALPKDHPIVARDSKAP